MLKIDRFVTASPDQWEIIIEGMRNPMNSWDKSDSGLKEIVLDGHFDGVDYIIGDNDNNLMRNLVNAGTDHRKFMRMIPVWVTLTAPLYWWKEFDTYKVGTVANSCSTMHKIHAKEFTLDDFSHEYLFKDDEIQTNTDVLEFVIDALNFARADYLETKDKEHWWQLIQLLPSSYNQRRTVFTNYEVLRNIYHARRNHKLTEWHTFCAFIETLPYSELITGGENHARSQPN